MHEMLKKLHRDHAQLNRLLRLLTAQLERFCCGDEPEFDLLIDLLDYMGNYADCVHHPAEDRLFEALKQRTDEGRAAVDELMEQHRQLAVLTREFRQALEAITQDAVIRRDEVEQKGRDYLALQRRHMQLEEGEVFPLLKRELEGQGLDAVAQHLLAVQDPLQDGRVQERYQSLYRYLLQDQGEEASGT